MEIYWKNSKIKDKVLALANSEVKVAKKMTHIKAAKDFNDLASPCNGRAHFLKGKEYKGCFAIDISHKGNPMRCICEPYGEYEQNPSGNFKKETITAIRILKIERDYHK